MHIGDWNSGFLFFFSRMRIERFQEKKQFEFFWNFKRVINSKSLSRCTSSDFLDKLFNCFS